MTATATIAQALATALGLPDAVQVGTTLDVEFAWVPRLELSDTDDMIITVVPFSREANNEARNVTQREHQIQIGVMHRVVGGEVENTLYNEANAWVEMISDWSEGIDLGIETVHWVRTNVEFLAIPEHLREMRQLTSGIVVSFKEFKSR